MNKKIHHSTMNIVVDYLQRYGYAEVDRKDNMLVVFDWNSNTMVFISVRCFDMHNIVKRQGRLFTEKFVMLCRRWCDASKWHGACRYDTVNVYKDNNNTCLDHIVSLCISNKKKGSR